MATEAVIFDWGGTLTPWHTIDHVALWQAVCLPHFPDDHERLAAVAYAAEMRAWELSRSSGRSSTILKVLDQAGLEPTDALLSTYQQQWAPHTVTDPAAAGMFGQLRSSNVKIGVLSNTLWPRDWHDGFFLRDGVLELIDGTVYSSEIDWTKPRSEAFFEAMTAVGVTDPARCVFVGDRPWDDIHGAKSLGMRAVLVPHSEVPPFDGARPDAVISGLAELPALIESWPDD